MKNYLIFITDDDEDDFYILSNTFNCLNLEHQFKHLKSGEELINILIQISECAERLPDIIILDYNMPKKNGLDVLLEIRKYSRLRNIPIIVYSTSDSKELYQLMISNVANGFITKNSSIDKIVDFVKSVNEYLQGVGEVPGKDYKNMASYFSPFRYIPTLRINQF